MAQRIRRPAEDHSSNRIDITVDTPQGEVLFSVEQTTPERRVTKTFVQRLREIGASRELVDFAERGAAEDARRRPRDDARVQTA